jgi:hypothetical protein
MAATCALNAPWRPTGATRAKCSAPPAWTARRSGDHRPSHLPSRQSRTSRRTTNAPPFDIRKVSTGQPGQAWLQKFCSNCYSSFTPPLGERSSIQAKERGLGHRRWLIMTSLFWNGSAFVPRDRASAKREAVVLRLEASLASPDANPSPRRRGASYLRRNGFHSAH